MPKERKVVPIVISAAIFILMEVAAIHMLRRNDSLQDIWFARGAHRFMASVWGKSENIKHYFSLGKENEALAMENFRLRSELLRLEGADAERKIDSISHSISFVSNARGYGYIPAEVVKYSRNKQHNYLIINKGSEDGVGEDSGIITGNGIVGIVDAVGKHHAYALSLLNTDVSIAARLGEQGAVGSLTWSGSGTSHGVIRDIPLHYDYEEGDTVYTCGFSTTFPPDIPLGTAGKSRVVKGSSREIKVNLFQDFTALRYVTVVNNLSKDEIQSLVP